VNLVCCKCITDIIAVTCCVLLNIADPLTTLASAAIFSAPPPTSTVVGGTEPQMKPETADTQQVDVSQSYFVIVVSFLYSDGYFWCFCLTG